MIRHFEKLTKQASRAIKHWWLMLIAGILVIAAGILVFVYPMDSYVLLSLIFGLLILIVGVVQLIVAGMSGNYLLMRGYVIVGGVLDIIIGLFLCFNPGVNFVLLPILLGLWLMYHSFITIAFGGDLMTFKVNGGGAVVLSGILLLLLSVFIILKPFAVGVGTVVAMLGIGLLLFGLILTTTSIKLRDMHLLVGNSEK